MKFSPGDPIAVDFDGTCVTHEYPDVGRFVGAQRVLQRIVKNGGRLILWTMRSGKQLEDAVNWFIENNIPLYGVQKNPTQDGWTQSPKAYAKIYIDDAALGCPLKSGLKGERPYVDWTVVELLLFGNEGDPLQKRKTSKPILDRAIAKCEKFGKGNTWVANVTAPEALALIAAGARPTCDYDFNWYTEKVKHGLGSASYFYFTPNKAMKGKLQ